ncbi:zinc ribbon domain-containing protein [Halobacterium hubeiense]|uniref:zinc ribbon domain-containing protein n=1 Tax=Halobacterium hubeiense TaxID=1407499 RepID=UPI003C7864A7
MSTDETDEPDDEAAGEATDGTPDEPTSEEPDEAPASETPEEAGDGTPGVDEAYCRNCGEVIDAKAEICPECGVRQRSPDTGFGNQAGIAAVASLLIPGAGQIYLGHLGRGLGFIVASFVAGLFSIFLIGIPFLLAIWVYGIYDAYHLAEDPERGA